MVGNNGSVIFYTPGDLETITSANPEDPGNNTITLGTGNNFIIGGVGTNTITAGDGRDVVIGQDGSAVLLRADDDRGLAGVAVSKAAT